MSVPESIKRISITVAETAEITGLSEPAVYRAVKKGEIEVKRLGGRILVLVEPLMKQFGL